MSNACPHTGFGAPLPLHRPKISHDRQDRPNSDLLHDGHRAQVNLTAAGWDSNPTRPGFIPTALLQQQKCQSRGFLSRAGSRSQPPTACTHGSLYTLYRAHAYTYAYTASIAHGWKAEIWCPIRLHGWGIGAEAAVGDVGLKSQGFVA